MSAIDGFVIAPEPTVHFGAGSIERLPARPAATILGPVLAAGS